MTVTLTMPGVETLVGIAIGIIGFLVADFLVREHLVAFVVRRAVRLLRRGLALLVGCLVWLLIVPTTLLIDVLDALLQRGALAGAMLLGWIAGDDEQET